MSADPAVSVGRLPAGARLAGRFHVEACLGAGASSTVYRALDLETRGLVALKVLDPLLARDEVSLERFEREMKALRAVNHANVVRVFALERDGEHRFLSMELVDGPTLDEHVGRNGTSSVEAIVKLARKLAAGLDACHRAGVVHRDVKPKNVLIASSSSSSASEPRLVDFGVAAVATASHLTRTGTYLGTPDYMAPEQFVKATADPRADVFSLGVVLYELLTGRLPHGSRSLARIAERASEEIPDPSSLRLDVPEWLDAVVLKCLETRPENRYQSAWELERELALGAQSLAQFQSRRDKRTCLRCRAAMLDGLSFCHQCGALVVDHFGRGEHAVVLYRCAEPRAFAERLRALGAVADPEAVEKRMGTLPRVLMGGIDEASARAVASELFDSRAELGIAARLPKELRLPRHYLAYGLAALAAALWLGNPQGILTVWIGVAAGWGTLVALYRRRAAPIIASGELRAGRASRMEPERVALAKRIGALRSRDQKELLAHIVRSAQKVTGAGAGSFLAAPLESLVERAVAAAETMDRCELTLSGSSLVELAERREAIAHRLERASLAESEALIEAKAEVERDMRTYRDLRDLHTRLHLGLINLNRAFQAFDGSEREALAFDPAELLG